MKQDTPMNNLLSVLDEIKDAQPEDMSPEALSIRACMDTVIAVIDNYELVEKEKQMIIDTYIKAQDAVVQFYDKSEAEQYYNETFESHD